VIAQQVTNLQKLCLSPEQIEKAIQPSLCFHDQLKEEIEAYEKIPKQILALCLEFFANSDKATDWLYASNCQLGDVPPISLFDTQEGIQLVIDCLQRLKSGVY